MAVIFEIITVLNIICRLKIFWKVTTWGLAKNFRRNLQPSSSKHPVHCIPTTRVSQGDKRKYLRLFTHTHRTTKEFPPRINTLALYVSLADPHSKIYYVKDLCASFFFFWGGGGGGEYAQLDAIYHRADATGRGRAAPSHKRRTVTIITPAP
jgi:hypothetical protein